MVAKVYTVAFNGIEVIDVEVQGHFSAGNPVFNVVGLGDKAITESRERVRAALTSLGIALPAQRIIVNLSPADLVKEGTHFDLPIAVSLLVALKIISADALEKYILMGELGLDGSVLPVSGVLPASIKAIQNNSGIICGKANVTEACWASDDIEIIPISNILQLINHFNGRQVISSPNPDEILQSRSKNNKENDWSENVNCDLKHVKGQNSARRALEIVACGGHNMLMSGPPGSGKSMLASCLSTILPPMTLDECLESNIISSVAGKLSSSNRFNMRRPYRDPHHSSSMVAMVGGGRNAKPGEISLAHNGVLFLDELPEYQKSVLESLRQPLETGQITISRANSHTTYPARFQLITAMNPCHCGYLGSAGQECSKAPICGENYQRKISGPFLDRIDIHINVNTSAKDIIAAKNNDSVNESSHAVQERVIKVRSFQQERYKNLPIKTNSELNGTILDKFCTTTEQAKKFLESYIEKYNYSIRGYVKILRTARTIADMEFYENINHLHMQEAISYRNVEIKKPKI